MAKEKPVDAPMNLLLPFSTSILTQEIMTSSHRCHSHKVGDIPLPLGWLVLTCARAELELCVFEEVMSPERYNTYSWRMGSRRTHEIDSGYNLSFLASTI
jgi:hypothetical protein